MRRSVLLLPLAVAATVLAASPRSPWAGYPRGSFVKTKTTTVVTVGAHKLQTTTDITQTVLEVKGEVAIVETTATMNGVPRHEFAPAHEQTRSYLDCPIPIGHGQTMSQPYTVAFMCEALELKGGEKVLEIGTGSGYCAAVLGELAREVWTIERIAQLKDQAEATLAVLGYANVHVRLGDEAVPCRDVLAHALGYAFVEPSSLLAQGVSTVSAA